MEKNTMKTQYKVGGSRELGYRIALPTKAKVADEYTITYYPLGGSVVLPKDALVYVPMVEQ